MSHGPPGNIQSRAWSGCTQAGGMCPQPVLGPTRARPAPPLRKRVGHSGASFWAGSASPPVGWGWTPLGPVPP